ncbi:MAG: zinc ABC transporter substrate-binding protein [Bacteroidia bacterium]
MKHSIKLILACLLFLSACKGASQQEEGLIIVCTTGIIADCISEIVEDKATVISLMGPGVDPHLYKASQGDLIKLSKADIVIYNGLHLEGKMGHVLDNAAQNKEVIAVGDFANPEDLKEVGNESTLRDPHIWFNPELWMFCMAGVVEELQLIPGLEGINVRFEEYQEEVLAMHQSMQKLLDNELDRSKRILITSHDAFSYFGDAYYFEVRGLQGISTAAEFGIKDVTDLIDFVIERELKALFIETSVSDRNLKAVVEGAEARGYSVELGGALYSDALGNAEGSAGSYIGMIKTNIETILQGLK